MPRGSADGDFDGECGATDSHDGDDGYKGRVDHAMSCTRSQGIDAEAFMIDESSEDQAAFRDHYPGCAECSVVVAEWSAFDLALRSTGDPAVLSMGRHPDPSQLEELVDAPIGSTLDALARIRDHVERCAPCRTEVALLRRFDPEALTAAAAGASTRIDATDAASIIDPIRRFIASWSERLDFGLAPAAVGGLAVAMLAILGLWISGTIVESGDAATGQDAGNRFAAGQNSDTEARDGSMGRDLGTPLARREEAGREEDDDPRVTDPESEIGNLESAPLRIAAPSPATISAPQAVPTPALAPTGQEERPEQGPLGDRSRLLADAQPGADVVANSASRATDPGVTSDAPESPEDLPSESLDRGEVILLAALTDLPMPIYGTPPDANSTDWMRSFGVVRGRNDVQIDALAPEHVGLTLESAPTFWWSLDAQTDLPIQITVVDEEALDPVARVEIAGPHAAGLGSISLSDFAIELEPDREYRWFATLLVDPDRPSRNPMSAGAVRVLSATDARRLELETIDATKRGHALARLGIWYDAYDFFATLATAHPENERLVQSRDRLLEAARASP